MLSQAWNSLAMVCEIAAPPGKTVLSFRKYSLTNEEKSMLGALRKSWQKMVHSRHFRIESRNHNHRPVVFFVQKFQPGVSSRLGYLYCQTDYVLYALHMSCCVSVVSFIFHTSYGAIVLTSIAN